jgi:predicted nuclease of predicted toxin-antitoxin system
MARLYANENFPLPVVQALRQAGHDVTTVAETGRAEQSWPDTEVLNFATRDERILLTLNRRHFIRLHLQNQSHAGIIVCTFDPDFIGQAQRIDAGISAVMDFRGQLIRVNRIRD